MNKYKDNCIMCDFLLTYWAVEIDLKNHTFILSNLK